jgi:hypothetical protein
MQVPQTTKNRKPPPPLTLPAQSTHSAFTQQVLTLFLFCANETYKCKRERNAKKPRWENPYHLGVVLVAPWLEGEISIHYSGL